MGLRLCGNELVLSRDHFSTVDIREIIRHVLGRSPSERGTCWLSRPNGSKLRQGRPPTIPKAKNGDLYSLVEVTGKEFDIFAGNSLHFLH